MESNRGGRGARSLSLPPPLDRNDGPPLPAASAVPKPLFEIENLNRGAEPSPQQDPRRQLRVAGPTPIQVRKLSVPPGDGQVLGGFAHAVGAALYEGGGGAGASGDRRRNLRRVTRRCGSPSLVASVRSHLLSHRAHADVDF